MWKEEGCEIGLRSMTQDLHKHFCPVVAAKISFSGYSPLRLNRDSAKRLNFSQEGCILVLVARRSLRNMETRLVTLRATIETWSLLLNSVQSARINLIIIFFLFKTLPSLSGTSKAFNIVVMSFPEPSDMDYVQDQPLIPYV